jgi:hypothetical protein
MLGNPIHQPLISGCRRPSSPSTISLQAATIFMLWKRGHSNHPTARLHIIRSKVSSSRPTTSTQLLLLREGFHGKSQKDLGHIRVLFPQKNRRSWIPMKEYAILIFALSVPLERHLYTHLMEAVLNCNTDIYVFMTTNKSAIVAWDPVFHPRLSPHVGHPDSLVAASD